MHDANIVSWIAKIIWYEQNGFSKNALDTFKHMQFLDVNVDFTTFGSILPICTTMGDIEEFMDIHQRVVENGFALNIIVMIAFTNLYAKCRYTFMEWNDWRIYNSWLQQGCP